MLLLKVPHHHVSGVPHSCLMSLTTVIMSWCQKSKLYSLEKCHQAQGKELGAQATTVGEEESYPTLLLLGIFARASVMSGHIAHIKGLSSIHHCFLKAHHPQDLMKVLRAKMKKRQVPPRLMWIFSCQNSLDWSSLKLAFWGQVKQTSLVFQWDPHHISI